MTRTSDLDGVLVIDKPSGLGSTAVVRVVRRAAAQRRVGHTGTLDPDATGVLVVCLGRATRLVRFLQAGRKTYLADVVLGVETTTQDASGEVVAERSAAHVSERTLCETLARFVGDLHQVPPMVSAVKVGGERLYAKARRGEEIEREPRRVIVHELLLESFTPAAWPDHSDRAYASLLVTCSAGTYIRTLAHDLGAELGCGASLTALRRLANGPFTVDEAHPLDEVQKRGEEATLAEIVLPLREAARGLPAVEVDLAQAREVAVGRSLPGQGIHGPFAVVCEADLLAIYADRGGQARPEAVFAQPDQFPSGP